MKCKNTVASLRKQGYKVRVTHQRYYFTGKMETSNDDGVELLSRYEAEHHEFGNLLLDGTTPEGNGGQTLVEITTPTGETLYGNAVCSTSQNYDRKLGVYIALGRAMKGLPTEEDYYREKTVNYIVDNLMHGLHYHPKVGSVLDNLAESEYENLEDSIKSVVLAKI